MSAASSRRMRGRECGNPSSGTDFVRATFSHKGRRERKIRVWREYRGLTIKALAKTSGLAAAYLSQIETGKREGTIETFKKIAAALRVDIDDIA
ncbi:MAG TPA: helix-turn-helix transcriptional regulator [Bradyrhizobium sp.]